MPSNVSRSRKSLFLKNAQVPMLTKNIKRKEALKKKGTNDVHASCKSSRLSPYALINKDLMQLPACSSCLKLTKEETGTHDNCYNEDLPLVFQNLISHIKKTKYRKRFDRKIEAKKHIEDATIRITLSKKKSNSCSSQTIK